ncbi:unnamed protein product [Pleuronectes platessa]|uniref:Uncharacterized protein n=1 Tax=Pleuronectes platessa TaxID=8262 RepID=A0A9N7UBF2_PLEPL|nr:unnamed protein product [Pleuronectes platessa]
MIPSPRHIHGLLVRQRICQRMDSHGAAGVCEREMRVILGTALFESGLAHEQSFCTEAVPVLQRAVLRGRTAMGELPGRSSSSSSLKRRRAELLITSRRTGNS